MMLRNLALSLLLTFTLLAPSLPARAGAVQLYSNNGVTTLAVAITSPTATSLSVASSAAFPALSGGNWFIATLQHLVAGVVTAQEIIKVTAVSGTTWTVVRAQEGTSGLTWVIGDTVALLPTAGGMAQFVQPTQAQADSYNYAVDGGSANAYVVALTPAITAHVTGMPIRFKAAHANTGASTFNDGAGAVTIVRPDISALVGGEITTTAITTVIYDGTYFEVQSGYQSAVLLNPPGGAEQIIEAPIEFTDYTRVLGTTPFTQLWDTAAPTNQGSWITQANSSNWTLCAVNDAQSAGTCAFTVTRTGNTVNTVILGGTAQTGTTQGTGDNSTNLATTAYLFNLLAASPALGGNPTATTQSYGDNTSKISTDAFVQAAVGNVLSGTIAANGSLVMPVSGATNGVIIKWGFHTPGTTAGAGLEAITFPVAFPHHCYFAAAFSNRSTPGTVGTGSVEQSSLSTTGFSAVLDQDGSGNRSGLWIAVGD